MDGKSVVFRELRLDFRLAGNSFVDWFVVGSCPLENFHRLQVAVGVVVARRQRRTRQLGCVVEVVHGGLFGAARTHADVTVGTASLGA